MDRQHRRSRWYGQRGAGRGATALGIAAALAVGCGSSDPLDPPEDAGNVPVSPRPAYEGAQAALADSPGDVCVANQVLVDIPEFPPVRTASEMELAVGVMIDAMRTVVAAVESDPTNSADAELVATAADSIENDTAAHLDDPAWWNQRTALAPIIGDPATRAAFERVTATSSADCPSDAE